MCHLTTISVEFMAQMIPIGSASNIFLDGITSLSRPKGRRWNGRYTVAWPDGTTRTRNIYAGTEKECEKLPAEMTAVIKAEVAAEEERPKEEAERKAG